MSRFSRRTLLAGSALAAAPLRPAAAQPDRKRNLLASAWSPETVAAALPASERFHPFPAATDRPAWEALPADARAALVGEGEAHLHKPWEALPVIVFLEYKRIGNRAHSDNARSRRRERLRQLVIAECVEDKGRFVDEIVNGIWLTCEETFWGSAAHLGPQKAGSGLPDVTDPIVDLFAAETSSLLAWTNYLLAPKLAGVSKLVSERIHVEIDRRILTPCHVRDDFSWMGFHSRSVNNWNPWICSNWLASTLIEERDGKRRQAAVHKIVRCLDNFLNGYYDDGGCDEGPGYWGRAGASLFDCLDLLHRATGGELNGFTQPLVREIGLYICRAHIHNEWYTNFADAPARVYPDGDLVYRFGQRVGSEKMMQHGAFAAFARDESGLPADSIGRQLPALFHLAELRKAPRAQALLRDTWLPGIQVMAARAEEGSARGLYLAAQGGHNAESHNHNDVGNFMVYADGQPAIIDVGVETYTAKTFSSKRYEIWTMQSAYHNCPTIDGVMQSAGREFQATDVSYHADGSAAEFRLNLAAAYPKEAGLESWRRTLRLDRGKNEVTVRDEYALRNAAKVITLTLMTPSKVSQEAPGRLALENRVKVVYDAAVFTPVVEEVRLEDGRLRASWGERIYRILLRVEKPPAQGSWTTRIVS
jgi:Heparinase II/III-like protein